MEVKGDNDAQLLVFMIMGFFFFFLRNAGLIFNIVFDIIGEHSCSVHI